MTLFNKFYGHYKDHWDYEMSLRKANITYREAYIKSQRTEEWF